MKFAYYPGCSLHSSALEYDISLRNMLWKLGVELVEIEDWICCGSMAVKSLSRLTAVSLPAKNLALTFQNGYTDLVTPCSACYFNLKKAGYEIHNNPELRSKVKDIIESPLSQEVNVIHPLQLLYERIDHNLILDKIVKSDFTVKVACYYGCLITRPPELNTFDVSEYPESMDELLKLSGFETVPWSYKTDCCGSSFGIIEPEIVLNLLYKIFKEAKDFEADVIAVACPLCYANLDGRQAEVSHKFEMEFNIPILYFSQLMGIALGVPESGIGLWKPMVDPAKLFA